jgi:hypothetical protein
MANRLSTYGIESDLVYPLDKGYYYIAKLDPKWVISELQMRIDRSINTIHNKYCIELPVANRDNILVTNHDGTYWLTAKRADLEAYEEEMAALAEIEASFEIPVI